MTTRKEKYFSIESHDSSYKFRNIQDEKMNKRELKINLNSRLKNLNKQDEQ